VTSFSAVVDIKAPPDEVAAVLFDVERWPEWTSTMTRVRRLDQGPLAVGSTARVRQPKLPPAVWQVTEFDAERGFNWSTQRLGLKLEAGHLVERNMAGSRVTLSFRFSGLLGPLAARFYARLCQRHMATEAEGLRTRCEG
jgi:Polyketide cyclase / dehydrase and lipid transport